MDALSLFNLKGGVGKSTLTPILAAAIKIVFPHLTVGMIAADTANGTLSGLYSKDLEAKDSGLWQIISTMISRRTQGRVDLLEEAMRSAVRPLTIVPSECNVPGRQSEFEEAAKALGVNPHAPLSERQIQFICTAKFMAPETAGNPLLNRPDSAEVVGVPLLQAFEQVLGWDVCVLDLPGEASDRLVKILTPWCTCVVIPSDVYKPSNLSMEPDVLSTLKGLKVTPAGFLANKSAGTAASNRAIQELQRIAQEEGSEILGAPLDILGTIRHLPTLANANAVFDIRGREFHPQDADWAYPEEGWFVGLHRAALDFRATEATRAAAVNALREFERVAMAVIRATPNLAERLSVEV